MSEELTKDELKRGIIWWGNLLKNVFNRESHDKKTGYLWNDKDEQFLKQILQLIEEKK